MIMATGLAPTNIRMATCRQTVPSPKRIFRMIGTLPEITILVDSYNGQTRARSAHLNRHLSVAVTGKAPVRD
jgi:hypothetical protein